MNTTKTGAAAIGAVALLVVLTACAGVRADVESGNVPQSQHELQKSARQESAEMRAELHAGATSVQSFATAEGIRSAKQTEARSVAGPSPSSVEGIRTAKQSEARADVESLRQHELEHGASSDRLR
ncbi:hypothetical protein [Agromyces cerinus]|uniref:Uncharacterized protein n=1 Tax=Agromyces cerinus subsp. cerinus TaxID=232089 RepID=A0A1N6EMZ7_9MICO|nr:hypothetical protein [Agromyces cerinus]SIN84469.1 hypothetical protein SAMN05443544_1309 [Agromyces cerinus subsp. cerinus]